MKLFILLASLFLTLSTVSSCLQQYQAIFNFGDSLSDTGNYLLSSARPFPINGKLPYGETFFRNATGRCSDGRLIVDFIGKYLLPRSPLYVISLWTSFWTRGQEYKQNDVILTFDYCCSWGIWVTIFTTISRTTERPKRFPWSKLCCCRSHCTWSWILLPKENWIKSDHKLLLEHSAWLVQEAQALTLQHQTR